VSANIGLFSPALAGTCFLSGFGRPRTAPAQAGPRTRSVLELELMMYAVVRTGGQQYKVSAGDTITIKRLDAEVGAEIALGDVLLVAGGSSDPQIGAPVVDGAVVKAQVVSHQKGDKRETFKYIPRHRSRVRRGFRPSETTVTITAVEA